MTTNTASVAEAVPNGSTGGAVIPLQRPAPSRSEDPIGDRLARLTTVIDGHSPVLNRTESKRKDGLIEHRFTCPQCTTAAAAVAYAGKKRVALYCDRKCGAGRILARLGLDREALTGRPDLLTSVPAHFRRIDVTNEVGAIHAVLDVIADGVLPHLYERGGALVSVEETPDAVKVSDVAEHRLRALLSEHTLTYRLTKEGDTERALPTPTTCATILARSEWHGVDALRGVAHIPALRPDGTVMQTPGYDPATGLYLSGHLAMGRPVPDRPTDEQVRKALDLLLGWLLIDFPWVSDADRANYLALLFTEVIRPRLTCPAPLCVVTAPDRGAGKTLLSSVVPGNLYGGREYAWPQDDAEMRKQITTMLRESTSPVLVFGNVPADRIIDYPAFAGLLTRRTWNDRLLGQSREVDIPNDRSWVVDGTNVRLGGDLGQRSYLVSIDPKRPRPDRRTGFKVPDLPSWTVANRAHLVRALLILARSWAADGAKTITYPMRGFTPWAEQVGGILAYHGIDGFMANADAIDVHDEDMETWTGFLAAWYGRWGSEPKRLRELLPDEETMFRDSTERAWAEQFPRVGKGDRLPGDKTLGRLLRERKGRFYGEHAAVTTMGGPRANVEMWRVIKFEAAPA